ncbi:YadA-like family protein [Microvirga makkahensis]|nr:YadA-like family protein [Microvirga makkahensis]
MAALRRAHRVLGFNRDGLGLGSLGGVHRNVTCLITGSALATIGSILLAGPVYAQYTAGGGTTANPGGGGIAISGSTGCATQAAVVGATNTGGMAVGCDSVSNGTNSIAIGVSADALAQAATAVGVSARATGVSAAALGNSANASGLRTVAIGSLATAAGTDSVAQGTNANASAQNAVAIGFDAEATAVNAINVGARTLTTAGATSESAIALGTDVTASAVDAIAVGRQSHASGLRSLAVGSWSIAGHTQASAFGYMSNASGLESTAIGYDAVATGVNATALGNQVHALADGSVAIGTSNIGDMVDATSINGISIGYWSQVTNAPSGIAMGDRALVSAGSGVAIGTSAEATAIRATALGVESTASGQNSTALGAFANAAGDGAVALGNGAGAGSTAANANSVAMGVAAGQFVAGAQNVAVGGGIGSGVMKGAGTGVTGTRNIAMGTGDGTFLYDATQQAATGNNVNGNDNIAVGTNAGIGVAANATTSIGYNANATANNAIAMGTNATADTADAVAIGNSARATGGKAVSIGSGNFASGNGAVAIGDPNTATGDGAVAQGMDNTATGNGSVAMGNTNMVGGGGQAVSVAGTAAQGAVGIGYRNTVIGQGSVALGNTSSALGAGSLAFGDTAVANNAGDVALGSGSTTATAVGTPGITINGAPYTFAGTAPTSTVSVGYAGGERTITNVAAGRISSSSTDAVNGSQLWATNTAVDGLASTVNNITTGGGIKYFHANSTLADSTATGLNSVAVGPTANSIGAGSVAIGFGSIANSAGDVAIGQGSTTTATTNVANAVIGGTTYSFAGAAPSGAFSVGAAGQERQIQNVAAGRLTSGSTDAVNGSQLFATNQQVTANTTAISNLGGAITDIAGDTSTTYVDANGKGIRYVRTNETGLAQTDAFAQGVGSSAVGYNATASAADALALGRDTQANIVGGVALGAGSIVDRPLAPSTGTLPAGPATIVYNTTDQTLLGAVSVGYAGAYRQITNVADGTQAQDAVTIRQLQGAIASVAVTPTQYFHANSSGPDSLAVGLESIAVGPRTVVNGNNGIGMGNGAIVEATAPGGTAIGQNAHVIAADGISLGTNSQSGGVQSVAIGAGAVSNHSGSVALGAGSATQAAVGTSSTTINGKTYAFAGTAPVSTVSVGDVGAERTITNVAAGRISATSTDAVNGSQLYATNTAIEDLTAGVGSLQQNTIQYETNADGSKKNSILLQGGDPNAPVLISNVAAGVKNTDAVNVKQLNDGIASSKSYTDQVATTTLDQAKDYTDSRFSQLNQEFGAIRQEARQAAAIGLAAASLRYDDRPGKLSAAVGGGVWRSEGAFALGAGYTSEDGRVRANLSAATAGGQWGAGAGLSITLN